MLILKCTEICAQHIEANVFSLTSFLAVVVGRIKLGVIIWELNTSYYQVILLIRGVRSQDQPVHAVVFPLWSERRGVNQNMSFIHS